MLNIQSSDLDTSQAAAPTHTTESPTFPVVSSPSSSSLKLDPDGKNDKLQRDGSVLSKGTQGDLSTSWMGRVKPRLSFGFGTSVAPNEVMTFLGQAEAEAAQDDDETTTRVLVQVIERLKKDVQRLQSDYSTGSSTLTCLYHDCFHIEAKLSQQIAECEATKESLRQAANLKVAEAQYQLSKAIWERHHAVAAANDPNQPDKNDKGLPLDLNMSSSSLLSSQAPGLQEAFESFHRDLDQCNEAQASLEAAETTRELAEAMCSAFRSEMK